MKGLTEGRAEHRRGGDITIAALSDGGGEGGGGENRELRLAWGRGGILQLAPGHGLMLLPKLQVCIVEQLARGGSLHNVLHDAKRPRCSLLFAPDGQHLALSQVGVISLFASHGAPCSPECGLDSCFCSQST